jgi:tetratricopeptide (TPR) repeat protein
MVPDAPKEMWLTAPRNPSPAATTKTTANPISKFLIIEPPDELVSSKCSETESGNVSPRLGPVRCDRPVTSVTLPPIRPLVYRLGCSRFVWAFRVRSAQAKATPAKPALPQRFHVILKRLVCLVMFSVIAVAAASAAEAKPVTTTEIVAWLIGGVPSARLVHLAEARGLAAVPSKEEVKDLESAGADQTLVQALIAGKAMPSAGSIPGSLSKAAAAVREQRFHDGELLLRGMIVSDPGNAALHFALAATLREQDQWDDAFDELSESTRLMPDLPENHIALAYIFFRQNDGANAIAEARTGLSMDPQNAEAYQYLGLGLYANGQYAAAVHAYRESLLRDGANADTYYDMGIALYADGSLPAAAAAYGKAIQLRSSFWEAHANLGLVLHEEGKLAEAVGEYREAKRLAPEEASVRNNLGNTYCDQNDFDAAITEMLELYREHPEWQQGHGCLASAYMAKRNYKGAIVELRQAIDDNPDGAAEHRILGQALLLNNQADEAIHEFGIAVSLNPDSDVAHHMLGAALFQQGNLPAAEKEFREAVRLNRSAENHYSLAACLISLNRYDEALAELELAARLDPGRPLYRARREQLLRLMKTSNAR